MQQAADGHQEPDEDGQGYGLQVPVAQSLASPPPPQDVRPAAGQRDEPAVQHRPGPVHVRVDRLHDRDVHRSQGGHRRLAAGDEEAGHEQDGGPVR